MVPGRKFRGASLAAAVLALAATGTGCSEIPPAEWRSTVSFDRPRGEILQAMAEVLVREGFQIAVRDDASGVFTTKWKVSLRAVWREGRRDRVELRLEGQPGAYVVMVRAPREINDNGNQPMSERDARWIEGGGDEDLAVEITYKLKVRISGIRMDE